VGYVTAEIDWFVSGHVVKDFWVGSRVKRLDPVPSLTHARLVAWHSGRTVRRSVTDELSCPTLNLQLMDDHLCGQTVRYKVS